MIVVAEDRDTDFEAVKYVLDRACFRLHVKHEIVQCKTLAKVENQLIDCEKHRQPLLLIFDNEMQLPSGNVEFIALIRSLWNADPGTWRGKVPIIIYSETRREVFRRFHHRLNSAFVNKIPEAGQNYRLKLRAAVYVALQAL